MGMFYVKCGVLQFYGLALKFFPVGVHLANKAVLSLCSDKSEKIRVGSV